MPKRATLADVANLAGMSTAAASMVLNNRPGSRLSAESARRIREAAEVLGYRPNQAARSLRLGSTRTVAFLSDQVVTSRYAMAMVSGLLEAADERDHTVLIAEAGADPARLERSMRAMLERAPDAVILGVMGAHRLEVPRLPTGIPVVLVNAASDRGYPTVLPAERTAGRQITAVLADAGHTDIAILGYAPGVADENIPATVTVGARFAGIAEVIAERGLRVVARHDQAIWEPHLGFQGMNELLDSGARFTGVICLNDRLAFGAYQAMQARGLRVPDDISLVSFDDDIIASYLRPGLTTAALPYAEMGRRAVEMALSSTLDPEHALVPMPLRLRESVRSV